MKILIIHEIDWIKKVAFEPHHLAEIFSLKGNQVFVIDCAQPETNKILEGIFCNKIKDYHRLYQNSSITLIRPPSILVKGLNRITHYFSCKRIIRETVKNEKIDIILSYGVATNGIQSVNVSKEFQIPIVFRLLDIAHEFVKIPILHQITKKFENKIYSNSTKVLTTTEHLAKYASSMGANKNSEKFLYGVNTKIFFPIPKKLELVEKLGISNDDKILMFMGTIYSFAGLDEFISKFQLIEEKFPDAKLIIVGDGPHRKKLEKNIIKHNLEEKIIITGFVDQNEIPKYLSLADICINTFEINNITKRIIPTKVLEYMACAKPVISTPLPGIKEFFSQEDNIILFSDLDKFHQTVIELLSDEQKRTEMSKNGSEFVQDNLNWEVIADALLEKFKILINGKKFNN
jgi:glycosyltransferase involved in cell wall biosynthesis